MFKLAELIAFHLDAQESLRASDAERREERRQSCGRTSRWPVGTPVAGLSRLRRDLSLHLMGRASEDEDNGPRRCGVEVEAP